MIDTPSPRPRATLGFLAAAVLPALFLADTGIAYARGWRPVWNVERVLFWIAIAGVLVPLALVAVPRGRRVLARRGTSFLVATLTTAVALAASEVAVGVVLPRDASYKRFHLKPPSSHFVSRPAPSIMPGVRGDAHYRTNALGIRATPCPPRDEAYRILCVGGSTTICQYLDDTEMWPHLLMENLNRAGAGRPVWVGNAGKNGYACVHHVRFLERDELPAAMDCLVFLVGVNDLAQFLGGRKPRFRDGPPPIWRRSHLGELLIQTVRRIFIPALEIEDEAGEVYRERRRRRQQAPIRAELPDLEPGLDALARRVRRMVEITRAHGARPIFVSQPVLWDRGLDPEAKRLLWFGGLPDGHHLSVPALREGMDRTNARIEKECAALGVEFVDLSPLSGRTTFFYDDCHFTEAGAREVARRLADHFIARRTPASWDPAPRDSP